MSNTDERLARNFVDAALTLRRKWQSKVAPPFNALLLATEDGPDDVVVSLESDPDTNHFALLVHIGPDALRAFAERSFAPDGRDDDPRSSAALERVIVMQVAPIGRVLPRMLEIFREARMPHPSEGLVPVVLAAPGKESFRDANRTDRKRMTRVLCALREAADRGMEPFRSLADPGPLLRLEVRGSASRPELTVHEVERTPWWDSFDFERLLDAELALPNGATVDSTWRCTHWIERRAGHHASCAHHGHDHDHDHEEEIENVVAFSDAASGHLLAHSIRDSDTPADTIDAFVEAMQCAVAANPAGGLPRAIEFSHGFVAGFGGRLLTGRDVACVVKAPPPEAVSKLRRALAAAENEETHRMRSRVLLGASSEPEWYDCLDEIAIAVRERVLNDDPGVAERLMGAYWGEFGNGSALQELDDASVRRVVLWAIATDFESVRQWATVDEGATSARAFVAALVAAKSSYFRVGEVDEAAHRVELIDLISLQRHRVFDPELARAAWINSLAIGRIVRVGGIEAFAPLIAPLDSCQAFSLLRDADTIRVRLTDEGVDDARIGRADLWSLDIDDDALEPIKTQAELEDDGESREVLVERATKSMRDGLHGRLNWLGGVTLREALSDPDLAPRARLAVRLWPALGFEDGHVVEPDRERIAREFGLPSA